MELYSALKQHYAVGGYILSQIISMKWYVEYIMPLKKVWGLYSDLKSSMGLYYDLKSSMGLYSELDNQCGMVRGGIFWLKKQCGFYLLI